MEEKEKKGRIKKVFGKLYSHRGPLTGIAAGIVIAMAGILHIRRQLLRTGR